MIGWRTEDDVWSLETIDPGDPCLTDPDEVMSVSTGSVRYWREERCARRHHDCSICRAEICPSEYYVRTAIPLHTRIVVIVECSGCARVA